MKIKSKLTILILMALTFNSTIFAQTDRKLEREKPNAQIEKRIALVIGNGAYTKAKPLPNPSNDAADMAATLKTLGFEVLSGVNLDKRGIENLIREFGNKLANGGVGLFYYAGHGIQVGGENYLVPVDVDIPEEDEVSYSTVPVNLVLRKMAMAGNTLNIVILDACRNNPFARSWRTFRDNSNADGLAKISPPTGTLVLYATEPGKVASDGTGRNGLFTESLLKQIKKPNVEYDQMVKALSAEVWQKSNKQQFPWKEGNSLQDFYFSVSAVSQAIPTPTPLVTQTVLPKPTPLPTPTPIAVSQNINAEELYWNEINTRNTKSGYELYLDEYPTGKYVTLAKNRIENFKREEGIRLKEIEKAKWQDAQTLNRKDAYVAYLTSYPNGEFALAAKSRIKEFDDEEARKVKEQEDIAEQAKWDDVQTLNRKSAYLSYLSSYPNGKYATSARLKIKEFADEEARRLKEQEKAREKTKWEEAERLKTIAGYDSYLSTYPNGDYASLARLRLDGLGKKVIPAGNNVGETSNAKTAGAISKATLPNGAEMSFAYIPAGDFMMGGDKYPDEKPVHKVTISQGFFMGRTEVTQTQWQAVMGALPSKCDLVSLSGEFLGANKPIICVSWDDAQSFIAKLNAQDDGFKYRLPTEAEWEYAARAGTTGDYAGNLDSMAWYSANSGSKTHEVGTQQANGWGLYDMHGNVWEWVQDWYSDSYYASSPIVNPTGATSGEIQVARGGGWGSDAVLLRSVLRFYNLPSVRNYNLGFRVVRQ